MAIRPYRLPIDPLRRLADAQAVAELLEFVPVAGIRRMQVLALGDQSHVVVAQDAGLVQDPLERPQAVGVDDQQFVLVEL